MAAAIAVGIVWVALKWGPQTISTARKFLASLKPKVEQKTTVLSSWPLIAIAVLLGPMLMPAAGPPAPPVNPPRVADLVDTSAVSSRALLADALQDFAGKRFDSDQAKEDAINEKIADVIEASYEPVHQAIAVAIKTNRVQDCADLIREGELRE